MRPVPALRRELTMTEHVSHPLGQKLADLLDAEPFLPRSKGQGVPCQRRRHDREIVADARKTRGVREHGQDLMELDDRTRPAVRRSQRHRVRALTLFMNEVQVDPPRGTLNCWKRLRAVSCARQSKPSRQ